MPFISKSLYLAASTLITTACAGFIPSASVPIGQGTSEAPPAAQTGIMEDPAEQSGLADENSFTPRPGAENALGQPVGPGPDLFVLLNDAEDATAAMAAFRTSCPTLVRREDRSGLTRPQDWEAACAAVLGWREDDAQTFFQVHFETLEVGTGEAFATGYFEPQIRGSRTQRPGYNVPVYMRPKDLVDLDLGRFSSTLEGKRLRGRISADTLVPYASRAEIEDGALAGRGLELAYAADPIEFFFLQIQGSGRLITPEGEVIRIGYNGQNGHDYVGIGRVLRERDALAPGQASMQGIVQWLRDNPDMGRELMRSNGSYIFFRELTGPGPLGALGYPVVGESSVAVDPRFVPMGAPVFLSLDRPEANGLWIAQDTGGAIKGVNRFDTFWGAGDRAREIAGGMSASGSALILVPLGTLERLAADAQKAP